MKIAAILLGIVILQSCSGKSNFVVNVRINNLSNVRYDSVKVYLYPDKQLTFYNIKPGDKIAEDFIYKNFEYKRGEALASGLTVFNGDKYFYCENGLVDIPFSSLEDNYEYFIYNDYATTIKGFKPQILPEKHKISEIIAE